MQERAATIVALYGGVGFMSELGIMVWIYGYTCTAHTGPNGERLAALH